MNYPDYMYNYGPDLVANGFRIIPLEPGTKRPGKLIGGKDWHGLDDWSKHCDRTNGAFELKMWSKWSGCGIGIACGYPTIGVDIDIAGDEVLAHRIRNIAYKHLDKTPAVRVGQAPKVLLVYRTKEPIKSIKRHPIEILGHGAQFVAYGIHPGTKQPYSWIDEGLADLDVDQLPLVTQEALEAFIEEALAALPEEVRKRSRPRSPGTGQASPHGASANLEAVRSAVEAIPNPDLQWDDWSRIGMAMWAATEGAEEGYAIFEEWSAKSSKHVAKACRERWDHWRRSPPSDLGFGTLYHEAQAAGWVPPAGLIFDPDLAKLPPAEILISSEVHAAKPAEPPEPQEYKVPELLLDLDGGLKEFVDWCTVTAPRPQPFLALAAALPLFGVLTGRRYQTRTGLRGNIYTVGIADSGAGKDHARKCVAAVLHKAGLMQYLDGDDLGSGQAILGALHKHPALLFRSDEFGKQLQMWAGKRAAAYKADIWTKLTILYSSADSLIQGTQYANDKERPREDVVQPCVGFMGSTVPGPFWQALQQGSLSDGSLARFLIFRTDNNYPKKQRDRPPLEAPDNLVALCQSIAAGVPDHDYGGNLADLMLATANPRPYRVPEDKGAARVLEDLDDRTDEWLKRVQGTPETALVARLVDNAVRAALIRAVARDPIEPVITERDANWSAALSRHCIDTVIRDAEAYIAENETEAQHKKLLHTIRNAGAQGITKKDLARACMWSKALERNQMLSVLIESGQVREAQETTPVPGPNPTRYYASLYSDAINQRRQRDEKEQAA